MSSHFPDKNTRKEKEPFGELIKSMNSFFTERPVKGLLETIDEFIKNPFNHLAFPVSLNETEKEYLITAELPGIKRDQIQIDYIGTQLTISINNQEQIIETDEINHQIHRRHSIQRSSRTINLPVPINEKLVKATYNDGLLQIRIPRKARKNIEIE
ncbi:Hsp20/alpha crystallin family protein [Pseudoneobacillus sp. C159]